MSARISFIAKEDPSFVGIPVVYSFELETRKLLKDGLPLTSFSPQATRMLHLLLTKPGELVSDSEVAAALWPVKLPDRSDQRIRDLISILRKPFNDAPENPRFFERIRQEGFMFLGVIITPMEEVTSAKPDVAVAPLVPAASFRRKRWIPAIGVTVAVLGFALLAIFAVQNARSASRRIQTELLWNGPSVGRLGDVSPDGRILCYTDPETEVLRARDLHTGETWAITSKPPRSTIGGARTCVFSHDGTRVAYRRDMGTSQEVHTASIKGTWDRILTSNPSEVHVTQDWSPDGKLIASFVCRPRAKSTIFLLNADTGAIHRQVSIPQCLNTLRFSPDGLWIAYDIIPSNGASGRIELLPADFTTPPVVLATDAVIELLGWTGNGSGIVYTINSSNQSEKELYYARVQGRNASPAQRLLSLTSKLSKTLAITRSGDLVYGESTSQRDCFVAALDFTEGTLLSKPDLLHFIPQQAMLTSDWSPDGAAIVLVPYAHGLKGESLPTLTQVRKDGLLYTLLHRTPHFVIDSARWQADGNEFLVSGTRGSSHSGLYAIRVSDASVRTLRESEAASSSYLGPVQSKFDRSVYYKLRTQGDPAPLYVMKEGQAPPDKKILPSVYSHALSPDGRQLVYSSFDSQDEFIRILDLSTGADREIHREARNGRIYSVAFTADSKFLLYAQRGQLWRLPVAGGTPQKLPLNQPVLRDLRPHPDGRRLAYTAGDPDTSDLWVMHNAIP